MALVDAIRYVQLKRVRFFRIGFSVEHERVVAYKRMVSFAQRNSSVAFGNEARNVNQQA